jgi:hypothetical protein
MFLGLAQAVFADQLTLTSGDASEGTFEGFEKHQLVFRKADGSEMREYAANVKSITVNPCPKVTVELINKTLDSVVFKGYDKYTVCLADGAGETRTPATMLKTITILGGQEPEVKSPVSTTAVAGEVQPPVRSTGAEAGVPTGATREWKQSGKWREMESPGVTVISRGEDVDVESRLKAGVVNVVHFHYAAAHSSVRQGNYIEVVARKSNGRLAMSRIVVSNWNAEIIKAKEIKALPQFWFYSRSGRLTKKLTDRFTESDIDAAIKQALQQL